MKKESKTSRHSEDLPSDDELEAMEDQGGTDIVVPEEFKKMREDVDKVAGNIAIGLKDNKKKPSPFFKFSFLG